MLCILSIPNQRQKMGHLVSLFFSYPQFPRQHPNLKIIGHRKEEHFLSSLFNVTNDAKKMKGPLV